MRREVHNKKKTKKRAVITPTWNHYDSLNAIYDYRCNSGSCRFLRVDLDELTESEAAYTIEIHAGRVEYARKNHEDLSSYWS